MFVHHVEDANVLFESVFAPSMVSLKKWKYKLHYSGESLARTDLFFQTKHIMKHMMWFYARMEQLETI
jgi:hypothetical protein